MRNLTISFVWLALSLCTGVAAAQTTTALMSSPNPSVFGSSVTFTATVSGGVSPSGTVAFKDGAATLSNGSLSGGVATFTTSALSIGVHNFTAVYSGDGNNAVSTSGVLVQTVNAGPLATTTALGVSPGTTVGYGTGVTLTGTISGGASPSGSITFRDGGAVIGSGAVASAAGALSTNTLAVGGHSLTASYSGDANNTASTSGAVVVTVNKASPVTGLVVTPNPSVHGQVVTFTASVSGGTSPAGSVTFKNGAATLGSSALSAGAALFATGSLATGSHSITAIYSGDTNHNPATSSAVVLTVNAASAGAAVRTDFNGDGKADILWRNTATGDNYIYFMDGLTIASEGYTRTVPLDWTVVNP